MSPIKFPAYLLGGHEQALRTKSLNTNQARCRAIPTFQRTDLLRWQVTLMENAQATAQGRS